VQINGSTFLEKAGSDNSPVYRWAMENAQVQRTLDVDVSAFVDPNAELTARAQSLIGYATVNQDFFGLGGGLGGVRRVWINRRTPAAYPADATPDNPTRANRAARRSSR